MEAWVSTDPLGGDHSLDLLSNLEGLPPKKAAQELKKLLGSNKTFEENYIALGIWDLVVTNSRGPYTTEFKKLASAVKKAAQYIMGDRDKRADKEDWVQDTDWRLFDSWTKGRPSGRYKRSSMFDPDPPEGSWYIADWGDVDFQNYEVRVKLTNAYTGETKRVEEDPGVDYLDLSPDTLNHEVYAGLKGGAPDPQQSILLTAYAENDEGDEVTYQRQMEIDPKDGEFKDDEGWEAQ